MTASAIYVGNTAYAELDGLADQDGAYQNDAIVTLESLKDKLTGVEVAGLVFPIAMAYVAGSNGKYLGSINYAAEITAGRAYLAKVKAIATSGARAEWEETAIAYERQ